MDNVYEFPDRAVIEQEAGEWIIKLDGPIPPTQEERKALQEWINRSPAHREEINSLADFWGKMNVLTELAVPLGKTETQIGRAQASNTGRTKGGNRIVLAAAACVVGFAVLLTFWVLPDKQDNNGLYATAVGQQKTTILADGSVIHLNTNSQLEVNYSEHYRDIRLLQGEAHFTVAKNPNKPFRVYAGNGRVQAVGTAFSVYLKGRNVDVTVTQGRVGLVALNQPPAIGTKVDPDKTLGKSPPTNNSQPDSGYEKNLGLLEAGQRATIKYILVNDLIAQNEITPIENIDEREMAKRLSWREGLLTFAGEPLEVVVAEISRYTPVYIEITDPAVRAIKIGGQFRVGETEDMLDSLETNFGLLVKRVGYNQVQLSLPQN